MTKGKVAVKPCYWDLKTQKATSLGSNGLTIVLGSQEDSSISSFQMFLIIHTYIYIYYMREGSKGRMCTRSLCILVFFSDLLYFNFFFFK